MVRGGMSVVARSRYNQYLLMAQELIAFLCNHCTETEVQSRKSITSWPLCTPSSRFPEICIIIESRIGNRWLLARRQVLGKDFSSIESVKRHIHLTGTPSLRKTYARLDRPVLHGSLDVYKPLLRHADVYCQPPLQWMNLCLPTPLRVECINRSSLPLESILCFLLSYRPHPDYDLLHCVCLYTSCCCLMYAYFLCRQYHQSINILII